MVSFLVAKGVHEVWSQSCEFAARTGQQATVAWLLEHGATLSRKVALAAAGSGNVQFLKVSTAQPAAHGGGVVRETDRHRTTKWLIEEKECPVNKWAYATAKQFAEGGGDAAAQEYLTSIGAHKLEREPSVVYRNGSWYRVVGF